MENPPISVSFFPRFKLVGRRLVPVVVEATKRTMYSNGVVTIEVITAERYHAAVGEE